MNIQEIEAQIELADERLQELAERLVMAESAGYNQEDAEWLDLAIEAQWLQGFKSEFVRVLQEKLKQQDNTNQNSNQEPAGPSPNNQQEFESNPPSYSNAAGPQEEENFLVSFYRVDEDCVEVIERKCEY